MTRLNTVAAVTTAWLRTVCAVEVFYCLIVLFFSNFFTFYSFYHSAYCGK